MSVVKNPMIEVENVNHPGQVSRVNKLKYEAMKLALMELLPTNPPGVTQKEIQLSVIDLLPRDLFPKGKTSAWWAKTVQLDLEAKGLVDREKSKPLRWYSKK